jgi:hypothetical protein
MGPVWDPCRYALSVRVAVSTKLYPLLSIPQKVNNPIQGGRF